MYCRRNLLGENVWLPCQPTCSVMIHFYFLFIAPTGNDHEFVFGIPSINSFEDIPHVMISTASADPVDVTVTIQATSFEYSTTLVSGTFVDVALPESVRLKDTGLHNKTVVVRSTDKIAVNVMLNEGSSGDGFSALPSRQLGSNYYVLSYSPGYYPSFISVSAVSSEATAVEIKTKSGETQSFVLQQYETYHLSSEEDFSGSRITSNHPVTVVAGTECSGVGGGGCDALVEAMPPVGMWGTEVVMAPFRGKDNGYIYRVLGTSQTTDVTISNVGTVTLTDGDWYQGTVTDNTMVTIKADYPILVMQFINGDGSGYHSSDPSVILAPSRNMYTDNSITFSLLNVRTSSYNTYSIHVITECSKVDGFKYDDLSMGNWERLSSTDGKMCAVRGSVAADASHTVSHEDANAYFTVAVYGLSVYSSYAYPAGISGTGK